MDNSRYIEQDEQLRDELIKRIREAGINVITDWKEGERMLQQARGGQGYTQQEIEQKIGPRLTANNYQDIIVMDVDGHFNFMYKIEE